MLHQAVFNTSEVCFAHGVRHAVLSPGSRNAPLTISFSRNKNIKKWSIPDERSAGFIALGIAQKLNQPVVLCCTSGTALLNYAPAIAEAFYREIPLIVLSADRPPELIDQRDGQTIRQFEVLKNHVKTTLQLPIVTTDDDGQNYTKSLRAGLQAAQQLPIGPVHLNIPFREPFYPSSDQDLSFDSMENWDKPIQSYENVSFPKPDLSDKKVLVLIGQTNVGNDLKPSIEKIRNSVPVLKSPLSNLNVQCVDYIDLFLKDQPELQPDVLITSGLSVLSKKLKNFLRKNKPEIHYHLDPAGIEVDTYETQPQLIKAPLPLFIEQLDLSSVSKTFLRDWKALSDKSHQLLNSFLSSMAYSETTAFHKVLRSIPEDIELHLGNSMPVRFAEILGTKSHFEVYSNRGTSGIDGTSSTAVGTSFVSERLNLLLTGDLAFLYDRNAFFHNYPCSNFRIIVINNQGGGIFRLIDGPKNLPELEEYFETKHNRTAEYICQENQIEYTQVRNFEELLDGLAHFFEASDDAKLLEIFTNPETNEQVYNALKQHIHEQISN